MNSGGRSTVSAVQLCNLALVGDGSVGKSSIIRAFCSDGFDRVYQQTLGCDFFQKTIVVKGDMNISLRVNDVGGQSINSKSLQQYLSSATVVFLVYDTTNPASFYDMTDWLTSVRRYAPSAKLYLIGNKVDLVALRQISAEQHDRFIEENDLLGGSFFSARTGENIVKFFYKTATDALGVKLTDYELGFHDKVLTAYISPSSSGNDSASGGDGSSTTTTTSGGAKGRGEDRTTFADEIEEEDRRLEEAKKRRKNCCIS